MSESEKKQRSEVTNVKLGIPLAGKKLPKLTKIDKVQGRANDTQEDI